MTRAYYNENCDYAAAWLRNLISRGLIAPGDVDERDIRDVTPADLAGYTQCHFFAGIGVWSYALRCAGVSNSAPVWTGSCPCQPFSAAGRGGGFADERHLWPHWHWLISQCRPGVVFGEQVASKDGLAWLDLVHADMEGAGYAFGALDLCAAGVGAPHIRQRLFFCGELADAAHEQRDGCGDAGSRRRFEFADGGRARELADLHDAGLEGRDARAMGHECAPAERSSAAGDQEDGRCSEHRSSGNNTIGIAPRSGNTAKRPSTIGERWGATRHIPPRAGECAAIATSADWTGSFWSDCDWLPCRDGKARPVEPGTFPLAHGAPARVGRLRAYGNAIVAPLAAEFIRAYQDA